MQVCKYTLYKKFYKKNKDTTMTNKMKLISTVTLALMSGSTFANCMIDEAKDGWTGSIKFHCDSDTNLLENPINFEITNEIQVGSTWGLPRKSTVTKF